jgi:hypothetical protein
MKSPNVTAGRVEKVSTGWMHGVNSVRNPWNLPADQLKWGVNVSVRGGVVQTRPGQGMRLSLPPGNLQGGCFFSANKQYKAASVTQVSGGVSTTQASIYNYDGTQSFETELPYIVFAVGGSVYFAPFPLTQPSNWDDYKLTNIQLDPNAQEVVFNVATQTSSISSGGNVTVTPANNLLVVQDGVNKPGYWDGSDLVGGQSNDMPIGYWMAFSGNRLWVAAGNLLFASDLGNPLAWTERTSILGGGDLTFPKKITAISDYVGQNNDTRLLVWTNKSTYSVASGVLDRAQWGTTANFQNTLFPTVGCIAGKSITFQAGLVWWYSQGGLVNANVAASAYLSSQVLFKDVEMARVKRLTPKNLSSICATSFENFLLCSIPYLEPIPSATMVLDYAPASELNQSQIPAWAGVWNGTRPIEWLNGFVGNQQRLFHLSVDYVPTNDGSFNHLWESFLPERVDSYLQINPDGTSTTKYSRIYCQAETGMLGDGLDLKQLKYGELECTQIGGTVDLRVSYKGSKGTYLPILNTRVLGINDAYQYENTPFNSEIESKGILRTQYRRISTESVVRNLSSLSCESSNTPEIDKAFSFLVEWCGEFGVEAVRMFMDPFQETSVGIPASPETFSCVVAENGESTTIDIVESPYEIAQDNQQSWFATETVTETSDCGVYSIALIVSSTATASAQSFVSLANAQQQARALASQAANAAIQNYRQQNPC